jgi:hypothetical protein
MKKLKQPNIKKNVTVDPRTKYIGIGTAAVIVLIIMTVLMFLESAAGGKVVVKNNTDLKLDYVSANFVYSQGSLNDGVKTESIEPNKSVTIPQDKINLTNTEANLEVHFKFEGIDELFTDAGYFNSTFDGKVSISFDKTDDPNIINLKIKATNGLFSSKTIDCNEEYQIDLSENLILE